MPELISTTFDWLGEAPVRYDFYNNTVAVYYDDGVHSYARYEDGVEILIPGVTTACHILDKSGALCPWAAKMATEYIREQLSLRDAALFGDEPFTPALVESWLDGAKNAHKTYKEKAGETGHLAHAWIEDFIKAAIKGRYDRMMALLDELPEDERARNGCVAALAWMARHQVRWIYTERKIYSKKHDFAGTMDGLAYVTACGDVKCCGHVVDLVRVPAEFRDVLAVIDWKTSNGLYPEYDYQTGAYTEAFNEEFGLGVEHRFIARLGKEDADFESRFLPPERLQDDVEIFLGCLTLYRAIERRKATDKAVKDTVKAAEKALKDAVAAAEKARKAEYKAAMKAVRLEEKALYKRMRAAGLSVVDAAIACANWVTDAELAVNNVFGIVPDDELQEAA